MKIFYSWQSDVTPNRSYVQHRLDEAAGQLSGWEVETATRNMSGAQDIAASIIEKINECDLFLADVSIINPDADGRKTPNPNVMLELGYALAAKGPEKIILLANTATTDTANLPFDIRNRRMMLVELNAANKTAITRDLAQILQQNHTGPMPTASAGTTLGVAPQFELILGQDGWANWGGNQLGSGFRYHLRIDNFDGTVDYIKSIRIESSDGQGRPWSASHFKFDNHDPNEQLRIEASEIKDVWVFVTDVPGQTQRLLPDIDEDTVKMIVTLRKDSRTVEIPISSSRLRNR